MVTDGRWDWVSIVPVVLPLMLDLKTRKDGVTFKF